MPSRSEAAKRGSGGVPMLGVPWCQKTASPPVGRARVVRVQSATVWGFHVRLPNHLSTIEAWIVLHTRSFRGTA